MARRAELALLIAIAVLTIATSVRAQGGACARSLGEWVERCTEAASIELTTSHCPPGRAVMRIGGATPTSVEMGPSGPNSFRRVGVIGLSPIGQFADWSKEPEARRNGFEALVGCVTRDPPPLFADHTPVRRSKPVPWLLLAALVAIAVALASRDRDRRRDLRAAATLVAVGLSVFALRGLLLPFAFFHQNGHGASWVAYALSDHPGLSAYGPGFAEVFGWAARAGGRDPDGGVFLLQALLGAVAVPLTWVLARGVGAPKLLSAALAIVVAFDPLLARLAQSESYFATETAFAFGTAALLAHTGTRWRSMRFAALVIAAGLLIAQAARIHPVGWVPFALLPIVVICGRGLVRRRLVATAIAGAGIAAIVALTSGPAMLDVLSGSLGQKWLPAAVPRVGAALPYVVVIVVVAAIVLKSWRAVMYATLTALVLGVMLATNMLSEPTPPIERAYDRLFWPVLLSLAAAGMARIARSQPRKRALAITVTGAGAIAAVLQFRTLTELPTDAREANLAMSWRRALPPGARVAYVERSGKHVFTLPLYTGVTHATPFPITLGDAPVPDLAQMSEPLYYYRSSVCSSPSAFARCEEIERSLVLDEIVRHELAARPSSWHPYASSTVGVQLSKRR